jgi:uncharacterized protein (TIRG00374 family)
LRPHGQPSPPAAGRRDPSPPEGPQTHHTAKAVAKRVAAGVVAAIAIYVVLPSLTAVIGAWPRLSTLTPAWWIASVMAEAASFTCTFALQRLVLRTKDWAAVVMAGLTGNAVTNLLPGGDAAGATVQFRMLHIAGIDPGDAAGGLAASSLLGVGSLLALPVFSLPAVLGGSHVSRGLVHAALLGLGGFALFVIGGVAVLATDQPLTFLGRAIQLILNKVRRRRAPITGLDQRMLHQRDEILTALGRRKTYALLLVAGRLGFDYLCLLAALRATGTDPKPGLVLLAYAAANIVALIPITPGGLGLVEASLTGMLVLSGVGPGRAVLATLTYRLASYWLSLIAGSVAHFLFRRRYGSVKLDNVKSSGARPTT